MKKTKSDSFLTEYDIDYIMDGLNNQLKAYGRGKKLTYDFKYSKGVIGRFSRLLVGALVGSISSYFMFDPGVMPYVWTFGVAGVYLLVPPAIRKATLKDKAKYDQIFQSINAMKMDLDATIYNMKRGIRQLKNLVAQESKVHGAMSIEDKLACLSYIVNPLGFTIDCFDKQMDHIEKAANNTNKREVRSALLGFIEKTNNWRNQMHKLYNQGLYAMSFMKGEEDYDESNTIGNKLLMSCNIGAPYKTQGCKVASNTIYDTKEFVYTKNKDMDK